VIELFNSLCDSDSFLSSQFVPQDVFVKTKTKTLFFVLEAPQDWTMQTGW